MMCKEYFTEFDKFCMFAGIVEYILFFYYIYTNMTISLVIYNVLYEVKTRWKILFTFLISFIISWNVYIYTKDVFIAEMATEYDLFLFWPYEFKIYGTLTIWSYIPLLIGLYYFYYRFQRNVSESHMINFYILPSRLIFTESIIVLSILVGNIEGDLSLCDAILLVASLIWILGFVGHVFHRLKINFFLVDSIRYFNKEVDLLQICYDENFDNRTFKRHAYMDINNRVEIIYQILEYIIDKNTNAIYNNHATEIIRSFARLKSFIGLEYSGKRILIRDLSDWEVCCEDEVDYALYEVFKNVLRFHKKICILLYEKYRNSDYDEAWKFLINIYPNKLNWDPRNDAVQKIINEIFKTYWSLSVYFLSRDRDKFQEVVSRINGVSLRAPEILKNIIIYRALLIATIEADNLNMLTEICYLQKRYINDIGRGRCLNTSKTMSKYKYYNGMMLYVLVQTTIKTIELSQYDLTGFLIKYIASNYDFDILIEICEKIIDNNIVFDYELKRETLYDRLGVNFRINIDTAFYFFKKFLFLVGIQYKSRLEDGGQYTVFGLLNKACNRFWTDNKRFNDKYCLEKILSVKDKYGMLSLNKLGERWGDVKEECEYDKIIKEL